MLTVKVVENESKWGGYEGSTIYFVENGNVTEITKLKPEYELSMYLNGIKDVLKHMGKEFEVNY